MPTFDESWSGRLRVVGDLERPDHHHLTPQDSCAFFGEYTARAGWGHSSTNQLILNLKKKPELAQTPQYVWKGRAIRTVADALRANLKPDALPHTAIVPIPPSQPPGSPGYDDRMAQVARAIGPGVDLREVLYTAQPREPMHANQNHRDPDALRASLAVRQAALGQPPAQVILLDDVLTTGCSFRVCKAMLAEVWPQASVFGVFVARRVVDRTSAFEDFVNLDL
jgi:hypothetical protein